MLSQADSQLSVDRKIDLTRMVIQTLHEQRLQAIGDQILKILGIHMKSLLCQQLRLLPTVVDIKSAGHALNECQRLIEDLCSRPSMANWKHGVPAQNPTQALANLLSRIVLELTETLTRSNAAVRMLADCANKF